MKIALLLAGLISLIHSPNTLASTVNEDFPEMQSSSVPQTITTMVRAALNEMQMSLPENFAIDWTHSQCLKAYIDMGGYDLGVCLIPFEGMQVLGLASVTINFIDSAPSFPSYKVTIANIDIE